uniref:Uncharacterized protein n=1 Tax=Panagrolaimus superbus TaxID=310955 RepID=A0A914XX42_9BILA
MFKERCRYGHCLSEMMGGCPRQYIEILKYVDSLRYYDIPNYNKIYKLLRTAMKLFKVPEFPYDWEPLLDKTTSQKLEPAAQAPV